MKRWLLVALMLAACSQGSAAAAPAPAAPTTSPPAAGGCGATPYHSGTAPAWALENAPRIPYVVGTPDLVLGYLFTPELAANGNNKILWYVKTPRENSTFTADGRLPGAPSATAHFESEANSGPGEIYPSSPQAPRAGCWHFRLKWAYSSAEVDLLFR